MQNQLRKGAVIHSAFGDYILEKQIGQGGNGRVFSATDSLNTHVANKFVPAKLPEDKRKRLKNEIFFCEHAENPYIIKILDHGFVDTEDGYSFYVMPLYSRTLRDKMKEGMSPEEKINVFCGILHGLDYAQSKEIVHRDIKPENILLEDGTLQPIICDFGIAHFSQEELLTAVETRASDRLANFVYAAPEQKQRGAKVSNRTDLYAAGLILNEMFTGEVPQAPEYMTISSVDTQYAFLDQIVAHLFKQNPEDRPESAKAVLLELETLAVIAEKQQAANQAKEQLEKIERPKKINLAIQNVDIRDNTLLFIMNRVIPRNWLNILQFREFSCGYIHGYEREKTFLEDEDTIGLRLSGYESQSALQSILNYCKDWVETTNELYNQEREQQYYQRKQEEEDKLRKKMESISNSQRLSSIIGKLKI